MICHQVWHGKVGTNVSSDHERVLLQVEAGEDDAFQQARASLTVEQTEELIAALQKRVAQVKEYQGQHAKEEDRG